MLVRKSSRTSNIQGKKKIIDLLFKSFSNQFKPFFFQVLREKLAAVPAPEKKKPAPTSDSNPEIVYQTSS